MDSAILAASGEVKVVMDLLFPSIIHGRRNQVRLIADHVRHDYDIGELWCAQSLLKKHVQLITNCRVSVFAVCRTERSVIRFDVSLKVVNHLADIKGKDCLLFEHEFSKPAQLFITLLGVHGEVV